MPIAPLRYFSSRNGWNGYLCHFGAYYISVEPAQCCRFCYVRSPGYEKTQRILIACQAIQARLNHPRDAIPVLKSL
jgi:hypothetical protein